MSPALDVRPTAEPPQMEESSGRLRGPALVVARVLWLALALPTVALTVIGVPLYYQLLLTPCAEVNSCANLNGALTTEPNAVAKLARPHGP